MRRYDGKNGAEVDAAIVATYLMLAAENEGLATLWVGSFDPLPIFLITSFPVETNNSKSE